MKQINQKDEQGLRHGVWENHYPDDTLSWRKNFCHGVSHGICESYFSDGTLWWREHYHYGKIKGIEKWRSRQGIPTHKEYTSLLNNMEVINQYDSQGRRHGAW
jgi:antitoxin component YwqK of YwqJK toxin-antitoxin module